MQMILIKIQGPRVRRSPTRQPLWQKIPRLAWNAASYAGDTIGVPILAELGRQLVDYWRGCRHTCY